MWSEHVLAALVEIHTRLVCAVKAVLRGALKTNGCVSKKEGYVDSW